MENYRDHMIGSFIVNVQPNDLDRVLTYLENRQVSWKYVDSENENILNGRDTDK